MQIYLHGVGFALSWFGGRPFVARTFLLLAFFKTLTLTSIGVL
jgi:hypothetical protein